MKQTNESSLGTVGLVLGIIAFFTAAIPIINIISFFLGILAFIFGLISVGMDNRKGRAIFSVVLGILSIVIFIGEIVALSSNTNKTVEPSSKNYELIAEEKELNKQIQESKNTIEDTITQKATDTNGTYLGERINGKKQGSGVYLWNDGSVYEGEFYDNKIHGQGELKIPNQGAYKGAFANGKKNGQGIYIFNNNDKYDGNWVDDMMSGTGTYTFANGDIYTGEFLNNQFNGEGTYTKDGKEYKGIWSNSEYQK